MTVLLWGLPQDGPLAAVARELRGLGVESLLVEQRRADHTARVLHPAAAVTGILRQAARSIALEDIRSTYLRPYDWRRLHDQNAPGDARRSHALAVEAALIAWAGSTSALVVNHPAAMASNESKPYQLELIRAAGFAVPPTLVTTDPRTALAFRARHGTLIYKSVSGIRSRVTQLSAVRAESLHDIAWCPTQFQRRIDGVDHRVHVVGDVVFASRVESGADDYRYAALRPVITATTLPSDVERRCLQLSAALELPLAGIDLRVTPDGEWYCFEVNPSPAFTYYECATGQPIAAAIAHLLTREP